MPSNRLATTSVSALSVYTATLTPAAVGANTCAAQSFTFTGVTTTRKYAISYARLATNVAYLEGLFDGTVPTGIANGDTITVSGIQRTGYTGLNGTYTVITSTVNPGTNNGPAVSYPKVASDLSIIVNPGCVNDSTCNQAGDALAYVSGGTSKADYMISVAKPTEQAGLTVTPGHVTALNTATLNFCNTTAAPITPTASELYTIVTVKL